ncbi:MAG: hypothetical protein NC078_06285 [Ruminococcus sp.]|nr:hypothetical protein [Ruminococcus sp.]
MGSLKCSGCGFGIHYHSEANGIEYSAVPFDDWQTYRKSATPVICFVSDKDSPWIIFWKCPECGTFHKFDEHWHVDKVYKPDFDDRTPCTDGEKVYLFSDFLLDWEIGEEELTASQFENSPNYGRTLFAVLTNENMSVFSDRECTRFLLKFKAVPMEEVG